MEWIESVAKYIIPLIIAIIAKYLIPILKEYRVSYIVRDAVLAAEQLWQSGQIPKDMRFPEAEIYIKNKLGLSDDDVRILIESMVNGIKGTHGRNMRNLQK